MIRNLGATARLLRDTAGTGALELAMALPMLLLLLVGMVDVSRLIAQRIDAEQAAQRATDFALAIRPTSGQTGYISAQAANAEGVEPEDVEVQIFLECDGVQQDSFNTVCPEDQDSARFVHVAIVRDVDFVFDWSSLATLFGSQAMGDGITVQGDSTVRFQ